MVCCHRVLLISLQRKGTSQPRWWSWGALILFEAPLFGVWRWFFGVGSSARQDFLPLPLDLKNHHQHISAGGPAQRQPLEIEVEGPHLPNLESSLSIILMRGIRVGICHNLGKTIINHPQFHPISPFWLWYYKPFPNGWLVIVLDPFYPHSCFEHVFFFHKIWMHRCLTLIALDVLTLSFFQSISPTKMGYVTSGIMRHTGDIWGYDRDVPMGTHFLSFLEGQWIDSCCFQFCLLVDDIPTLSLIISFIIIKYWLTTHSVRHFKKWTIFKRQHSCW